MTRNIFFLVDFDIAVWRSEYNLPDGVLEDKYIQILLDALGLSYYMGQECETTEYPFNFAVDNWVDGE